MKRAFDIVIVILVAFTLFFIIIVTAIAVRLTSQGPVIFWSKRVGRGNKLFWMPKFRTMRADTPAVATHLLVNPERWLTPIGSILRKTSVDELPQLWSVFKGDMSIVGPRPALYNQNDLIQLRTSKNVHMLLPGLTGWAQINGRDEISVEEKVQFDFEYSKRKSLGFDIYIVLMTVFKVLKRDGVTH